jgi:hypothetical protein
MLSSCTSNWADYIIANLNMKPSSIISQAANLKAINCGGVFGLNIYV